MAQVAYRANLSSATFPMTIADGGRTVIIPGPDQNFDRRVDPEGEQKDAGIPQALYLENVMPTANGYQSVNFVQSGIAMTTGGTYVLSANEIFASSGGRISSNVIYQSDTGTFRSGVSGSDTVTFVGTPAALGDIFSSAVVNNVAYVLAAGSAQIYESLGLTGPVVLTNVTASVTPALFLNSAPILQILSFANYLIAFGPRIVYWSSLTTPLDFTSSLISGAGQITPNDFKGRFIWATVCADGFYIFTTEQAIFVQYTGNARYPFKFTQVKGFNGVDDQFPVRLISAAGSLSNRGAVAVEKSGQVKYLQQNSSEDILSELSNFLRTYSAQALLDYSTNVFTEQAVYTPSPNVYFWNNRYVVVSINDNSPGLTSQYTHALVFDTLLRRVGKLKVLHKFLASFSDSPGLGFVDSVNKRIRYLNLDVYNVLKPFGLSGVIDPQESAILLGKFQYVRSRMIQMEEIEIEGPQNTAIVPSPNFSVALIPSADGRNFDAPIPLTPRSINGGLAVYNCHRTAQNHSILIKGAFSINTVQLKFVPRGDR